MPGARPGMIVASKLNVAIDYFSCFSPAFGEAGLTFLSIVSFIGEVPAPWWPEPSNPSRCRSPCGE
jgi:hypothetical protein